MGTLEIVAGALLILSSLIIIIVVLSQESKGQGLSGVITGTDSAGEGRVRTKDAKMARLTKIFAVVFFVLTLIVNIFSIISK